FELYHKAANSGYSLAQYNLGLMYEYGKGIEKDINQAIYWYEKSAKQGYQLAQNRLEIIMTKNKIKIKNFTTHSIKNIFKR
ncbi:hypothetical protein RhiirC2_781142, partial [Rhizophagus irregularis]